VSADRRFRSVRLNRYAWRTIRIFWPHGQPSAKDSIHDDIKLKTISIKARTARNNLKAAFA